MKQLGMRFAHKRLSLHFQPGLVACLVGGPLRCQDSSRGRLRAGGFSLELIAVRAELDPVLTLAEDDGLRATKRIRAVARHFFVANKRQA